MIVVEIPVHGWSPDLLTWTIVASRTALVTKVLLSISNHVLTDSRREPFAIPIPELHIIPILRPVDIYRPITNGIGKTSKIRSVNMFDTAVTTYSMPFDRQCHVLWAALIS